MSTLSTLESAVFDPGRPGAETLTKSVPNEFGFYLDLDEEDDFDFRTATPDLLYMQELGANTKDVLCTVLGTETPRLSSVGEALHVATEIAFVRDVCHVDPLTEWFDLGSRVDTICGPLRRASEKPTLGDLCFEFVGVNDTAGPVPLSQKFLGRKEEERLETFSSLPPRLGYKTPRPSALAITMWWVTAGHAEVKDNFNLGRVVRKQEIFSCASRLGHLAICQVPSLVRRAVKLLDLTISRPSPKWKKFGNGPRPGRSRYEGSKMDLLNLSETILRGELAQRARSSRWGRTGMGPGPPPDLIDSILEFYQADGVDDH
jgi:hypothetical protein